MRPRVAGSCCVLREAPASRPSNAAILAAGSGLEVLPPIARVIHNSARATASRMLALHRNSSRKSCFAMASCKLPLALALLIAAWPRGAAGPRKEDGSWSFREAHREAGASRREEGPPPRGGGGGRGSARGGPTTWIAGERIEGYLPSLVHEDADKDRLASFSSFASRRIGGPPLWDGSSDLAGGRCVQ